MKIVTYADATGKIPFREWLYAMQDKNGQKRIMARLARLEAGNFRDCKPVREGVQELKIDFGPGVQGVLGQTRPDAGVAAVWKRQGRPGPRHQAGY